MKRLLLLLAVLLLCSPIAATSLTFQKPIDQTHMKAWQGTSSPLVWHENQSGGNEYLTSSQTYITVADPLVTAYAACGYYTVPGFAPQIALHTIDGTLLAVSGGTPGGSASTYRLEATVSAGGDVHYYKDGIEFDSDTTAEYPAFISFSIMCDDFVYGTNENRYIFSMPDYSKYKIIKDTNNAANSGFGWVNGTIISATSMTTTWGRSNITHLGNQSVIFRNVGTQTVYLTKYTDTNAQNTETWPLSDLFSSDAQYGLYEITILTSGVTSDPIVYTSIGATMVLDSDTYTNGDTAVATYTIEAAYKGLGAYRIDTMDVYGNVIDSQAVSDADGSVDVAFSTVDPVGVYYTVLIVEPTGGGSDIWLAYDYAELNGYVMFNGYVNDAETEAPIAAHVNISQGSTIFDYDTVADDGYQYNTTYPTTTMFLAGTEITTNITASGYRQYTYAFTPALAKTVALNFTLIPESPTYDIGLAIGGVARETTYGRPIPTARVDLTNVTHSEACDTTTNSVGYYLADYGLPCPLTVNRNYQVWGSKTNYENSTIYNVIAEGAI